jgi:hypothetical protein
MNCTADRYFNVNAKNASDICNMCNGGDPSKNDTDHFDRDLGK